MTNPHDDMRDRPRKPTGGQRQQDDEQFEEFARDVDARTAHSLDDDELSDDDDGMEDDGGVDDVKDA
jgi:hypothetical protein